MTIFKHKRCSFDSLPLDLKLKVRDFAALILLAQNKSLRSIRKKLPPCDTESTFTFIGLTQIKLPPPNFKALHGSIIDLDCLTESKILCLSF